MKGHRFPQRLSSHHILRRAMQDSEPEQSGAVGPHVSPVSFISPGLCGKQLVVMRGSLIVVLPVPDHRGQALADKGLSNVSATEKTGQ